MTKEKKKNLKPIYWVIIAEVIVAVVGLLLGFKITYAPHLENDWDAISACAGWASVIVAGLAIYYAIQVPVKIADEQNRIALFEKRHDFYITFCVCTSICRNMEIVENGNEARRLFYRMFSNDIDELDDEIICKKITPVQMNFVATMSHGIYLFDFDVKTYSNDILKNLAEVLSPLTSCEKFEEHRKQLIELGKEAEKELTPKIEAMLNLVK